jgi:signal transduction histidine kinase
VTVSDQALVRRAARLLNELGPRARVVLSQLPLVLALAVVLALGPGAMEELRAHPRFVVGLGLQLVIAGLCLAVPWERLPENAPLAVPLLDFVSLWLLRNGSDTEILGLGNLTAFPVIWIAASTLASGLALAVCFVAPFAIVAPTLLDALPSPSMSDWAVSVALPLVMLATGAAIRITGAGLRVQERRLRSQQAHLRRLLERAEESERLLSGILDTAEIGIVAVGRDGRAARCNRRFRQMLDDAGVTGGNDPGQLGPLPLRERDGRTPVPPARQPIARAAAGEHLDGEVMWLGPADSARALSVRSRPLDGDGGGAVITFGDVTPLLEDVEAKTELVRTVAHEFRTPLTAVLGQLDLALDIPDLPAGVARRLGLAQSGAERLVRIASDLLASSAEVLPLHPARVDVGQVVRERAESALPAAAKADIAIDLDVDQPLPARADPFRVGQAVDNLLSNAIKYSPSGGTVTLSARAEDGWIAIGVADTGMGIRAEDRPLVFERFFRSDEARRAHIPGVGLGLAITKTIAERHGGELGCVSTPGKGSTFTFRIPAAAT